MKNQLSAQEPRIDDTIEGGPAIVKPVSELVDCSAYGHRPPPHFHYAGRADDTELPADYASWNWRRKLSWKFFAYLRKHAS